MRLPRSTKILQLTVYRSLYAGFYNSGSDVFPPQFSSREVRLFFDPQVAMVCLHTLCKFRLFVDIWFTNSFFAERFGYFFFFLIVPMNPLLFLHIWVPTGDPTCRVLVQVKTEGLYSPLRAVPIYIALSFFPIEEENRVSVFPKKRLSRVGVCLFAGCTMSYTIRIRQSLAVCVSLLLSNLRFAEQNSNLNFLRLIGVQDTKRERERERERETTEFCLKK